MNKCYLVLALAFTTVSVLKAQTVYHVGKMAVGEPAVSGGASWVIKGDLEATASSNIKHAGKTVLTGDFVNNNTSGNIFSQRDGTFEFRGATTQRIYGKANKASSYINFPATVLINNSHTGDSAAVILASNMGATMKNIRLARGRLVLDSEVNGNGTENAHLLTETGGTITYTRTNNRGTRSGEGIIQVNLAMGNNTNEGRLAGFSSPFQTLYADYFFFNFLSLPTTETFFAGNKDIWNTNPLLEMPAGKGYVVGQGIVTHGDPYYTTHKNTDYAAANVNDMAKEEFSFARLFAPLSITQFVTNNTGLAKRFTGEALNNSTVEIDIQEGYNYLGNPFTVPLDMTSFVNNPASGTWGTFSALEMEPAFYILSSGSKGKYLGNDLFSFTASYLVGQKIGSTTDSKLIAPMQMFAVKKRTTGTKTFKINAASRTHGNVLFLRSDENSEENELLIETKDNDTGGFDRLCIVFRQDATLAATDVYDAEKLFNTTGGVNQIYTCSSDNKKLSINVLPLTTTSLPMYFEPSSTLQQVTLTASRINSLSSIGSVKLEDKRDKKTIDLVTNPVYTFSSSPMDDANRFILHFTKGSITGLESLETDPVPTVSYQRGIVYISGLPENNIGKKLSLYNIQGQLIHLQEITQTNPCKVEKILNPGVYIVKVEENHHVMKLLVNNK